MTNEQAGDNEVFLRGRLAEPAEVRELPSGDELAVFRLTVDRPETARGRVDSIECEAAGRRVRRSLERAAAGDVLEVSGSLRRRFWRGPSGPQSRYSVEVCTVRVVSRAARPAGRAAGRRGGASPGPTRVSA